MNRIITSIILLSFSISSYAQKVIQEKILVNAGKELGLIGGSGVKTVIKGAGMNSYNLISALDFTNIIDDGFLIRKKYVFTKYNESMDKQWEVELEKTYGLSSMPYSKTIGNKFGIYFLEISDNPVSFNQIHITRFDSKGQIVQTRFTTGKKYDGAVTDFVTKDGYHTLLYKIDQKAKTINYTLVSFSSKDLSFKEKPVSLESDLYEIENSQEQKLIWGTVIPFGNKIILTKNYFKDIPGSRKKEVVLKTIEMDFNGSLTNSRSYSFEATSPDTKYEQPKIMLDTIHNELYVIGTMMVDNITFTNGIYVKKYNYSSGSIIYNKELNFKNFKQYVPEQAKKQSVDYDQIFPIASYLHLGCFLEMDNRVLRLLVYKYATRNNTEIRLGQNGELIQAKGLIYKNPYGAFSGYELIPEKINPLYEAPDLSKLKTTPLDFVNSLSNKMDTDLVLCSVFEKKECNIVVYIREKDGEIKAFKLAK
jgi:hypothetical protein